jgi:hypothetical protein
MHHETKLEKASADVTTWRDRVRTLNENIAKAEAVAAASIRARQENVLSASLGDSAAKENLATVLEDDRRAERHLSDLQLALPLAMAELANAEGALKAAETEFRKKEVERLAIARVAAATAIDQAFADFSRAWGTFSDLGQELLDLASQEPNSNPLYLAETISGEARLVASLPAKPFLAIKEKFPFMAVSTHKSLADSERSYWRLPAVEEVKAA